MCGGLLTPISPEKTATWPFTRASPPKNPKTSPHEAPAHSLFAKQFCRSTPVLLQNPGSSGRRGLVDARLLYSPSAERHPQGGLDRAIECPRERPPHSRSNERYSRTAGEAFVSTFGVRAARTG